MTPRERMVTLLEGGVPDEPPHWELVFQIADTMFGIDVEGPNARDAYTEVAWRLIDECGWAAIPALDPWDPQELEPFRKAVGSHALVPGYDAGGVFWMPTGEDLEDFVLALYEDPDSLHREARRKCDEGMDRLRRQADAGADFFMLTYDFGYNQGPFVSPAQFDKFCAPYLAEMVAQAHDLGKKAILHSDGCLNSLLDSIGATGIDGYQSVDPQGHMVIAEVRERFPDWILMGNVPCSLLQSADEPAIRAAVDECMTHGGDGRPYIFSTSNCIFAGMPPESYRMMVRLGREWIAAHRPPGC